jgi:hypothetical protein
MRPLPNPGQLGDAPLRQIARVTVLEALSVRHRSGLSPPASSGAPQLVTQAVETACRAIPRLMAFAKCSFAGRISGSE